MGRRREGETGRKRQREAGGGGCPASRAVPTPPRQGPREREGQRLSAGDRIQGRCVFGFPHVLPPPISHLDVSRLPPAPESGTESGSELRTASSSSRPRLARTQGPDASPAPSPLAGARVPRAGLGRRRGCAGRPQAGVLGAERRGVPSTAPRLLWIKDSEGAGPLLPPATPFRGAAPTSSARAVQAASRTSAKPGSIATLRGAPSALLCEWDPPSPCSAGVAAAAAVSCGPALALLRVLSPTAAEETDGAAARRRGSEPGESADRPSPLGTRERPLAEPPGSCARSAGRGPRPRRPQVRRPRLPRFPERLPGRLPPEPHEQ